MKKYFGIVLVFVLVILLGSMPVYVGASDILKMGDFGYEIVDGEAIIRWYSGLNETVVIPETLDGFPVVGLGFLGNYLGPKLNSNLVSITLPSSLRFIGNYVFSDCRNLEIIIMPSKLETIGEGAFERCYSLKSIVIPESVKSIGDKAFYECTGIRTITIPEGVETIGMYSFLVCDGLESAVVLSDSVGYGMFWGCKSLKAVKLAENVKVIETEAFSTCYALTSINIPKSVTKIGYSAFYGTALSTIVINNGKAAFEESAESYENPHFPTGPTFEACDDLETIYSFRGSQAQSYSQRNDIGFTPIANVSVNGKELALDVPAVIEDDRVLVPMRAIFEELGASVAWDDATRTATATRAPTTAAAAPVPAKAAKTLSVSVGANSMLVDGKSVRLDVPARTMFDRTLVPARAVGESLGAKVDWDEATQTVLITT